MNYNFKWANERMGVQRFVSISKLGIALNQASIESLGSPENILIGFDEDSQILGIVPASTPIPAGAKVFPLCNTPDKKNKSWLRISCKGYVRYLEERIGKKFSKTEKLVGEIQDGVLIVDLGDVVAEI